MSMVSHLLSISIALAAITSMGQTANDTTALSDSAYGFDLLRSRTQEYPAPPEASDGDSTNNNNALEYVTNEQAKEQLGTAIYEDALWMLRRNQSVYAWQDFATKIIFVSVLTLVFVGVFFSGLQFFRGFRATNSPDTPDSVSNVELSMKGMKVSSPFLGVIILVVSFAFFYLYLVYVYPVR